MNKSITVQTKLSEYDVIIEEDAINNINKFINIENKVFIITDKNVEKHYLKKIKDQFDSVFSYTINPGEESKSLTTVEDIIVSMQKANIVRSDYIIALGGGVVGDLAGFIASIYMRGISYINIPTTTLSQIDSSVGGKVAVNFNGIKNFVGNFYNPKLVIIDPLTLLTLDERNYNAGLIEAVKMGITSSRDLFNEFLNESLNINEIIYKAVNVKKAIVEADQFDNGIRNILNFGHTLAHAFEMKYEIIHGEAVLYGMLYEDVSDEIKERLLTIRDRFKIDQEVEISLDLIDYMLLDKKINDDNINLIKVEEIGEGEVVTYPLTYLKELLSRE